MASSVSFPPLQVRDIIHLSLFDIQASKDALADAEDYLRACGIFVPHYRRRFIRRIGGSGVTVTPRGISLTMGCYPTRRSTAWFTMHELQHVLVAYHKPYNDPRFTAEFGAPEPPDYDHQQWKSALPAFTRPRGYASYYGRDGGGEEHLAELVAYMYVQPKGFASPAPKDLAGAWRVAWNRGAQVDGRMIIQR